MWHADDPEEEVLAMVVRTGLHTSMGSMVRQILSPSFTSAEKHPFLQVELIAVRFMGKVALRRPWTSVVHKRLSICRLQQLLQCMCIEVVYCTTATLVQRR